MYSYGLLHMVEQKQGDLLCEDTGCSPENLPEAMNDREVWWERVRDICADDMTMMMILNNDVVLQLIRCTFKERFSEHKWKKIHTAIFTHVCILTSENQVNVQTPNHPWGHSLSLIPNNTINSVFLSAER